MKRLLLLCALAGLVVACSDDDDDGGSTDSGVDSGIKDAGPSGDGGGGAAKVAMVGAACTTASTCGGTAPVCATSTWAGVTYPGGHCEAVCTADNQCGTGGICPLGAALANPIIKPMLAPALMTETGVCYKTCSTTADCRTGYTCESVIDSLMAEALRAGVVIVPSLDDKACLPEQGLVALPGDGGVGDAGTARSDGGLDGGLDAGR